MCPNHVENFLDANLVTSTSLTERLKVWQKYARRPIDTETVRLEFFRKVRSGKLFQRGRVKRTPLDNRVKARIVFPKLALFDLFLRIDSRQS